MSESYTEPQPLLCWTVTSQPRNSCIKLSDEPPVWMVLQQRELISVVTRGETRTFTYSAWQDIPMRNPEGLQPLPAA